MKFKTSVIFSNRKTKWSIDFGICKFMAKNTEGRYVSKTCPGCYAATLLNVYSGVRNKLEANTGKFPNMDDFKRDIKAIKDTGHRFIRFYSLGDFSDVREIEYIHAAADIMPVELFSKTLHTYFRKYIPKIASHPKVNISLSTNKSWDAKYIEELASFIVQNKLAKNVQLNYTFIGDEEVVKKPFISVYHTTKKDKTALKAVFGRNRICCARDEQGKEIVTKNSGNHKGSCARCPLCKLPAANANGDILVPKLMQQVSL